MHRPQYADSGNTGKGNCADVVCRGLLQPSKQQNLITGMNLLRLLVQNRIAEFHTELELIPQRVWHCWAHLNASMSANWTCHFTCRYSSKLTSSMPLSWSRVSWRGHTIKSSMLRTMCQTSRTCTLWQSLCQPSGTPTTTHGITLGHTALPIGCQNCDNRSTLHNNSDL